MLIEWGCKEADKQGKLAYVDASDAGKPVYMKFGFEQQMPIVLEIGGGSMTVTSFLRPVQK